METRKIMSQSSLSQRSNNKTMASTTTTTTSSQAVSVVVVVLTIQDKPGEEKSDVDGVGSCWIGGTVESYFSPKAQQRKCFFFFFFSSVE
jgi:hypothetical protein